MKSLFQTILSNVDAVLSFFENVGAATRVSNDIKRGRNPRDFDMQALGISDAYRSYRAV
ncbi:hypothetical protein [Pelagibius sp. Alg239-R121]|uniref:hypothetical protein n=1 Tax=Pelagibius sp. Alg239-R121 TaxID=2993448 RepID=UPI0024A6E85C|nr:hypothetical protein [Pelagibius sp. Alg239-R121]